MHATKTAASMLLRFAVVVAVMAPIGSAFYKYYLTKNYNFLVEAPCVLENEKCFVRDCSVPDNCPRNNLSSYKKFLIKAKDFNECVDDTCLDACSKKLIDCKEIKCGENEEDTCNFE